MNKNYVYEILNLSILTDDLSNIIRTHNIPHTSNKNGTFINISLLDESYVRVLEGYIKGVNNNKTDYITNDIHEIQFKPMVEKKKNIQSNKIYKKLKLGNLEQQIISFS